MTIIGNANYNSLGDKKDRWYINTTALSAQALSEQLTLFKIKHSGIIEGEKGTITVNKKDYKRALDIAKESNINLDKPKSIQTVTLKDENGNSYEKMILPSNKEVVLAELKKGIEKVVDGENFRNFCQSKSLYFLRNYSFQNAMLIWLQNQHCTYVASAGKWKTYGRMINAGEKGLKVRVPCFAKEGDKTKLWKNLKYQMEKNFDKEKGYGEARIGITNISILYHNGLYDIKMGDKILQGNVTESTVKKFIDTNVIGKVPIGFTIGTVFDVSQTNTNAEYIWLKSGFKKEDLVLDNSGKPIQNIKGEYKVRNTEERIKSFVPTLDLEIKEQDSEKMQVLYSVLKSVSSKHGCPVAERSAEEDEVIMSGADGYFSRKTNSIAVKDDLSITTKCAVLFHEIAHSEMHKVTEDERDEREIQAEAVAYITAQRFGIETQTSSFNYISSYTQGRDLSYLENSLNKVWNETRKLSLEIDNELKERGLTKEFKPLEKPLSIEERQSIIKERQEIIFSFAQQTAEDKTRILPDCRRATTQEEVDCLRTYLISADKKEKEYENVKILLSDFEKAESKPEQDRLIGEIRKSFDRIGLYNSEGKQAEKEYQEIKTLNTLEKKFIENPYQFLKEQKEFQDVDDTHLRVIAQSTFIKKEYAPILNESIDKFKIQALKQADNIIETMKSNQIAVEVVSSESWGTPTKLEKGMVLSANVVNDVIKRMECELRIAKVQAKESGEYYPSSQTQLSVYDKIPEKDLVVLTTTIDIGNGQQNDLTEHLKQISKGEIRTAIFNDYQKSLKEKTQEIHVAHASQEIENNSREKNTTTFSADEWKTKVQDKDKEDREDKSQSKELNKGGRGQ